MSTKYRIVKSGILLAAFLAATTATASAAACCGGESREHGSAGNPEKAEGIFGAYEKVSAALVEDDAELVRTTAGKAAELAEEKELGRAAEFAEAVAEAEGLEAMREAFIPLSREVIKLAAGEEGLYVMHCPMVENGKWLQSTDAVQNPYMGQRMIACGGVEMETADIELRACCEERSACCDDIGDCCPV